MKNMYFWIQELSEKSGLSLRYLKQMEIKPTVEYILHVVLLDTVTHKKYMCALSFSDLQKFRMDTSVQLIYKMKKTFNKYYCFNDPVWLGKLTSLDAHAVLYEYFENAKRIDINDSRPIEVLDCLYEDCEEKLVTDSLIEEIAQNILKYNYPANCHAKVRELKELKEYISILRQMKKVKLINTHLDYSPSNIMINEGKMYLIDYEQGGGRITNWI